MTSSNARVRLLVGLLVVGLLVALGIGVGIVLAIRAVILNAPPRGGGFAIPPTAPPFQHPGPGTKDFAALFADYGASLRAKGVGGERAWDVPRFAREVDRTGILTRSGFGPDHPDQLVVLQKWLADQAVTHSEDFAYDETEVQNVRWIVQDREAVIDARHVRRTDGGPTFDRQRWWVVWDGGWRFYDHEDVSGGGRDSAEIESGMAEQAATGPRAANARRVARAHYDRALDACRAGDYQRAEPMLADPLLDDLSVTCRSNLARWRVAVAVRLGKHAVARDLLTEAERRLPGEAWIYGELTECQYRLGEHEKAVAAADRYIELIGPDGRIRLFRGHALVGLGRRAEAAVEYRRALDDDPDEEIALAQLSKCLGDAGAAEVEARYRKFRNPAAALPYLLREAGTAPATVAALVRVAREKAPPIPKCCSRTPGKSSPPRTWRPPSPCS